MFALGVVAVIVAYFGVRSYLSVPLENQITVSELQTAIERIDTGLANINIDFQAIFLNNVRASIVTMLLGMISFSVVGVLAYMANMGLLGGLFGAIGLVGLPQWPLLLNGVLPHGIFELPAIALLSAAVLHMGVVLVTPDARKTFTLVMIEGVADWLKLFFAIALPALIIAAIIETTITPVLLNQAVQQLF
jgi:stage II sporulation protein M